MFYSAEVQVGSYVHVAYGDTRESALEVLGRTLAAYMTLRDDWRDYFGANVHECEIGKGYVR